MAELITAASWLEQLDRSDSTLHKRLAAACGGTSPLADERISQYKKVLTTFIELFGPDRPVAIVRSPGRLNVLGMHVDHRGGFVNPMALSQEVVLVFTPNTDDLVDVTNLSRHFGRRTFRIGQVQPPHTMTDTPAWLDWTQSLTAQRAQEGLAADWTHKLAAPCAYLAGVLCPDRPLKGFSGVISGNIMQQVGLSSSSAVVVAATLAMSAVNDLSLSHDELVEHCGIAEWYVGTRGGFGDHAAILRARAGQLVRVRTVPELAVSGYEPFPDDYRLLVFHSGQGADKTGAAGNTFNRRTATYDLAEMLAAQHLATRHARLWNDLSQARTHLSNPKPMHLGDIVERLDSAEIYELLNTIPDRADRKTLTSLLPDRADDLRRQFATHQEPPNGYPLRFVLLYGLSECARAARGGELLKAGNISGFAELMNISHDGDRVSNLTDGLARRKSVLDTSLEIWQQPGDYACSTPEVDSMVDIALEAGALGAQISGAGLGGSMMALVHAEHKDQLVQAMQERYYEPNDIEPRFVEALPSAGATVV